MWISHFYIAFFLVTVFIVLGMSARLSVVCKSVVAWIWVSLSLLSSLTVHQEVSFQMTFNCWQCSEFLLTVSTVEPQDLCMNNSVSGKFVHFGFADSLVYSGRRCRDVCSWYVPRYSRKNTKDVCLSMAFQIILCLLWVKRWQTLWWKWNKQDYPPVLSTFKNQMSAPSLTHTLIQTSSIADICIHASHQRWHTLFLSVIKKIISLSAYTHIDTHNLLKHNKTYI